MKNYILIGALFCCVQLSAQNVGIGTTTPQARLHVADSSVVFDGGPLWYLPLPAGNTPVTGAGVRMLWYPGKAAFRTGAVSGDLWNKDSIGKYSFASGLDVKAKGDYAAAFGVNNNALDWYTFAAGGENTAAAAGAIGMGVFNTSRNMFSVSIGNNLISKSVGSAVLGSYNDTADTQRPVGSSDVGDRIFQVGNGNAFTRSNALTVLRNGNTGIGVANPAARLHINKSAVFTGGLWYLPDAAGNPPVENEGVRMMWYADKAAFRTGAVSSNAWNKDEIGEYSFAAGLDSKAKGNYSAAIGVNNNSLDWYSFSAGNSNTATGVSAVAIGNNNKSRNTNAVAIGNDLITKTVNGISIGSFNDTADLQPPTGTAFITDRIFQIGNGSGFGRSNAITVLRNGNMGIGTVNPAKPISFPPALGEKILLYPGTTGEVGIGVYGNELRLHCDNAGSMVSFGTQDNAGNFTQAGRFQISGGYALYVNGSIWANGTTYASDQRFKQNITAIESPLQKLLQLNGVEYEMNDAAFPANNFKSGRQIGLLAQNVEKIIPEAVNELDGYKGVDYAKLVPLLIESIKEQQRQLDEQKKMIDALLKK
jgi:Chaperone of endosialidase/Head domain of trimeric autotransporter adhesin